jgi:sortase A
MASDADFPRVSARRRIGQLLVVAGLVVAARPLAVWLHATQHQWTHRRAPVERPAEADSASDVVLTPSRVPRQGEAIGTLDIPRIGVSAIVAHGDDAQTLDRAIGHLPDTPLPWAPNGNSALAGHRDTFFRPLRRIRVGDEAIFRGSRGSALRYRVTETLIVEPQDVWVLAPTDVATLTLITCYPFGYIGAAPQRFVVRAVRVANASTAPAAESRGKRE